MVRATSVANVQISTCVASALTFRESTSTVSSKQLNRPMGSADEFELLYEEVDVNFRISGVRFLSC